MIFLQLFALAFFSSLAVSGFMVYAGLGDIADHRSAHKKIVPTSGGLGLVAGFGAAVMTLHFLSFGLTISPKLPVLISLIFAAAMLGLIDDVLAISARIKFGILLIICGAAVHVIGPVSGLPFGGDVLPLPYLVGVAGSILWLFVVVNAVNFMDGANGFMGSFMAIASLGLFGVSMMSGAHSAAVLSLVLSGGLFGFLPYNLRNKALVFCGDVGALTAGFVFAIAVLLLVRESGAAPVLYVGPILILPFLADVLLTLIRRVRAGDNLLQAHNKHLYQRIIRMGWSHVKVTWLYAFLALLCANVVLMFTFKNYEGPERLLLGAVGFMAMGYYLVSKNIPD